MLNNKKFATFSSFLLRKLRRLRRIFSVEVVARAVLLFGLTVFVVYNLGTALRNGGDKLDKWNGWNVLIRAESTEKAYEMVAQKYLALNDFQKAEFYNKIGRENFPFNVDLMKQENEIFAKLHEPENIKNEIIFLEKLMAKYPDYRDGWARLAYLNLRLGDEESARGYIEKIREINPNWEALEKLRITSYE